MSHYTIYSLYVMGTWGHLYTPYVMGSFEGVSVHLLGISESISTSICPSVYNSHTSFSPSLWVVSLMDWMPMDVYYASCCWLVPLFVVFLFMSEASTTMALTTTALVSVVCSTTSSILSTITMALSLMGLPTTSGKHDVVRPPSLTPRNSIGVVGLATMPKQQPQSLMPLQAYANYAMGPSQVGFSFRVEPPTILFLYVWCLFWCMISLSGAMLDAIFIYWATPLGFEPLQPFRAYPWQAYVQPGSGHQLTPEWLFPPLLWVGRGFW